MRKFWRIFAVLATMAVLLSALLLTVAAENEGGNTPDIPIPGEGVEQPDDTTEQTGEGNDPSGVTTAQTGSQPSGESSTSTTDTSSTPTENTDIGGGEQPSAPIESTPTEPIVTPSTGQPTLTSTQTTRPRPTTTTTAITTTETTTETTDAVIIPTSTKHPFFGSPSPEEGKKPTNNRSDHDNEEPLPIGKWALYSILALLIMVGGGVAIYLITHTLQK